jgi:hypothetical protein
MLREDRIYSKLIHTVGLLEFLKDNPDVLEKYRLALGQRQAADRNTSELTKNGGVE